MEKETYASAGVDIDAALKLKKVIAKMAQPTFGPEVMRGIGFFGGLYEFKGYKQPVLVSHVDGVGTKMKIAIALNKHDTIGMDIVNHCVNDIFTGGATPLFFQDYIAMGKLNPPAGGSYRQRPGQSLPGSRLRPYRRRDRRDARHLCRG